MNDDRFLPAWATAALSLSLVGLLAAGAARSPGDTTPPELGPGTKSYQLDVTADSHQVLRSIAVTEPLEVREVRGAWILVQVPGLAHGPVWLNTEQIAYFRTTRDDR